jgi:hypothetical protein
MSVPNEDEHFPGEPSRPCDVCGGDIFDDCPACDARHEHPEAP